MADMPTDLKTQIDKLEEQFVVTTAKLKEISDHFVSELKKGLSDEGGSIVSGIITGSWQELTCTAHDSHLVHGLPRR
jgi:hexokinase